MLFCYTFSMEKHEESQRSSAENQEALHTRCLQLEQQVRELMIRLQWYEAQFRLHQHQRFLPSSEKTQEPLPLFDEAEKEAPSPRKEPSIATESITYARKKTPGQRELLMEDLPVERIDYTLPEEDRSCPQCQGPLHLMSTSVRKELIVVPAQVKVREHVQHSYACRYCQQHALNTPIVAAPLPVPVISGSYVSPSLMASIMCRKFEEALPLYRQEQQFQHQGLEISRQTMARWMIEGSHQWLSLLYERMKEILRMMDSLHADETELQVLREEGRSAARKSYMWHYASGACELPIALYEYQTTRAHKHPDAFLKGFKGYLHTDGYAAYHPLASITVVGCWAHARRKFTDALKSLPSEATAPSSAHTLTEEGLAYCNRLFAIEQGLKDLSPEERYLARKKALQPIMEAFHAWLTKTRRQALPKAPLGRAVAYCLSQWSYLERVLLDGRLELSNNRAERGIKPFVIGRKNWLFSNTPRGAQASAIIYSMVETAKRNGLIPFHYLSYLFEQLPQIQGKDPALLEAFLPWSKTLPENCYCNPKT